MKNTLRHRAEEIAKQNEEQLQNSIAPSADETRQIIHELHVHQIELEMQNDELRQIEKDLEVERRRYFDLYNLAPIGYCTLDKEGMILEANLSAATMLGVSRSHLLNQPITRFIFTEDQDTFYLYQKQFPTSKKSPSCEIRMIRKNKAPLWVYLSARRIEGVDGVILFHIAINDISDQKEYAKKLEQIAHYDALTALPNRILLADRLHQGMIQAQRHLEPLAVIYLDLDGFKEVNDNHGHKVGDQLLIALSSAMKQALRDGDTLSRIGGDEFVAVLPDLSDIEASVAMIERLLATIAKKVFIGNIALQVSASLGVTFFPQSEEVDADQLLRQADQAMYQAKLAGKNRYHVFDIRQNMVIRERYEGIKSIHDAIDASQFILYYQPKVNMRTGAIIGVEALIRWQHPQSGFLEPALFLPLIEENSVVVALGEWVIETALMQIEYWQTCDINIPISVNINARHLQEENFVDRLILILSNHPNVNPAYLELEILETDKLKDILRTTDIIKACKEIGITFSLDDFGTGYSSLTYLLNLPISMLKIDQSFVRDMLKKRENLTILEAIIALGSAFNLRIIAEGVETLEHGKMLLSMGCEFAQGYAIARPMPPNEFPQWSAAWHPDPLWDVI